MKQLPVHLGVGGTQRQGMPTCKAMGADLTELHLHTQQKCLFFFFSVFALLYSEPVA